MMRTLIRALLLTPLILAPSCSGGGGDGSTGTFAIESCSLGCTNAGGGPFSCSFQGIHLNEVISVRFTGPVDLSSVNKTTFRVTDSTGISPLGEYRLGDTPNDVLFKPLITFNSTGNPVFGLEANETYQILIPGKAHDPVGPYIRSTSGQENATGLNCFLQASQGVMDLAPGPPLVEVSVDQVTAYVNDDPTQDPSAFKVSIANAGTLLSHVSRDTEIRMKFSDIMNPATLSNPVTGKSDFIQVRIDPDGNIADTSDQLQLFGTFLPPVLDNDKLETTLIFRLNSGLPSAGGTPFLPGEPIPADKRRVVIAFSPGIRDLGGNPLANSGLVAFVPEVVVFDPTILPGGSGEKFLASTSNRDNRRSAQGMWGAIEAPGGSTGLLAAGAHVGSGTTIVRAAGGSGRLGDLQVQAGTTLELGTGGTLRRTTGGIAVSAANSPFFQYLTATTTQALPATGRVVWDQQQIFGREPVWADLGLTGPPKIAVQVQAEDPLHPGEFKPVWVANDGVTPLTMNVVAATYTNTRILDNYDPEAEGTGAVAGSGFYSASSSFAEGQGADGVFEFSSLRVNPGGRLTFSGPNPARVFARGEFDLRGVCDISGHDAPTHSSVVRLGSEGALGGPGGGRGGRGGDRFDHAQGAFEYLNFFDLPVGGMILVSLEVNKFYFGINNVDDFVLDGSAGQGVGLSSDPGEGGGRGGVHWPPLGLGYLTDGTYTGLLTDFGNSNFGVVDCRCNQLGAPGGGGTNVSAAWPTGKNQGIGVTKTAHVVGGLPGAPNPVPAKPADTAGGDVAGLDLGDLSPDDGNLRGGAGGGGGGAHNRLTRTNGKANINCSEAVVGSGSLRVIELSDHSGAAGGGGGGALQVQAGRQLSISGFLDATGGRGGSRDPSTGVFDDYKTQAMPGGGGSGGTLLFQSPTLQIATSVGRIDLSGGDGGSSVFETFGGDGSIGVLRMETPLGAAQDLSLLGDLVVNANLLTPGKNKFTGAYPDSIVSIGTMTEVDVGPGAFSGVQSCWMQPDGNFFQVEFQEDGAELGWDMNILFENGLSSSFRAPATAGPLTGLSLEEVFGSLLRDPDEVGTPSNSSPIVVRFQGARAVAPISEPCNVDLSGADPGILVSSVTPWLYHPAELNDYWSGVSGLSVSEASQRRANMIRFQIVFDGANPYANLILGVNRLQIRATPD